MKTGGSSLSLCSLRAKYFDGPGDTRSVDDCDDDSRMRIRVFKEETLKCDTPASSLQVEREAAISPALLRTRLIKHSGTTHIIAPSSCYYSQIALLGQDCFAIVPHAFIRPLVLAMVQPLVGGVC
mmetsp:Transcript_18285/g.29156  ORF Transcript_18285/g.29156 Transcript_18285/m.29156 type:complete len:125 (-) Transcript_18285:733-1107(-)